MRIPKGKGWHDLLVYKQIGHAFRSNYITIQLSINNATQYILFSMGSHLPDGRLWEFGEERK